MDLPKVGEIFQERYLIRSQLGSGGMGTVYRAKQLDANREVALKLLRQEGLEDEETVKRFYREFKMLSRLEHEHILTIYGMALDKDNTPYAICEYIEGRSLRKVLNESGAMPWQRVTNIVLQVCAAMQYAHEHGIVHRDLKPDNIMILETPEPDTVKIIDFGLSKTSPGQLESQKLTKTGQLIGSAHYMSPEQIKQPADARSDIYSLGCIIFEMLSGEYLFDADASIGIIYKHGSEDPRPRINAIKQKLPLGLLKTMEKALAKHPEQRQQSMQEISQEISDLLKDPGTLASNSINIKLPRQGLLIGTSSAICLLVLFALMKNALPPKTSAEKLANSKRMSAAAFRFIPAYSMISMKEAYLQARDHTAREQAAAVYCRRLESLGLSKEIVQIGKKERGLGSGIWKLQLELEETEALFKLGKKDEALTLLRKIADSIKNTYVPLYEYPLDYNFISSTFAGSGDLDNDFVDVVFDLGKQDLCAQLIDNCDRPSRLLRLSAYFRNLEQFSLSKRCLDKVEKAIQRNKLMNSDMLTIEGIEMLPIETAMYYASVGDRKTASKILQQQRLSGSGNIAIALAIALAAAGQCTSAEKLSNHIVETEPWRYSFQLGSNSLPGLPSLERLNELLAAQNTPKKRAYLLCLRAEAINGLQRFHDIEEILRISQSHKISDAIRIQAQLMRISEERHWGLNSQALDDYNKVSTELARKGMPKTEDLLREPLYFWLSHSKLDVTSIYLLRNDRDKARALIKEAANPSGYHYDQTPSIVELALRAGYEEVVNEAIDHSFDVMRLIETSRICLSYGKVELALRALNRGFSLANEQKPPNSCLLIQLVCAEVLCRWSYGSKEDAKALLKKISFSELETDCKNSTDTTGLDNIAATYAVCDMDEESRQLALLSHRIESARGAKLRTKN